MPSSTERETLESCRSEPLYYGYDRKPDFTAARKCAYVEREHSETNRDRPFAGSAVLAMVYANGYGVPKNLDLAIKFACEIDGAPAENSLRFDHLRRLKDGAMEKKAFDVCDDVTSGYMQGWCTSLYDNFAQADRARRWNRLVSHWTPAEKKAFGELRHAADDFFEARARSEVDMSGTARAAFQIEAKSSLEDALLSSLERFEKGHLPHSSAADFKDADHELNAIYEAIQSAKDDDVAGKVIGGTVTPEGVRAAQRVWLRYRDAWVKFGAVKYPTVNADSWRTWLTRDRIRMWKHSEPEF